LPYTQYLPEALREPFVSHVAAAYLERFPLDEQGQAHVHMVRLEVEAVRD
jgi:trans-aconitate 2-methyltransferase